MTHGLYPTSPWDSLSIEFSRQEYWHGLLFPFPGDLPDPGMDPESPMSPALAGGFFTIEPPGNGFITPKLLRTTDWSVSLSPP